MKKTEKDKTSGGSMKLFASDFADLEEALREGTEKVEKVEKVEDNLDQAQLVGLEGEEGVQEEEEAEEVTEEEKVILFCTNLCSDILIFLVLFLG